jgi:hypothetical protein
VRAKVDFGAGQSLETVCFGGAKVDFGAGYIWSAGNRQFGQAKVDFGAGYN